MNHFSDGTPYVTSVLLEGMDKGGNIYFSKHSEAEKKCCVKLSGEEFINKLNPSENKVNIMVIKYYKEIEKLNSMNLIDAYNYIFKEIFNYSKIGNKIFKNNQELKFSFGSLNEYAKWLKIEEESFIGSGVITKHNQFKLNVHINNKIMSYGKN